MSVPILPARLSEWIVREKIGEGASGSVYRIEKRIEHSTLICALKIIHVNSEERLENVITEVSAMQKLQGKSNIVQILDYECCRAEMGWDIYIRMELLQSLEDHLDSKPNGQLSEKEVIRLGINICDALKTCEKEHMLHRDLKIENIFLDEQGAFKLGDFGVVCMQEEDVKNSSVYGTTEYMPPEMILRGENDPTADLYALGILLYRLCNRRRVPFVPGIGLPNVELERIAEKRRLDGEKMPPPSFASEAFAEIILKACNYERRARYQSASKLKRDLEVLLKNPEGSGRRVEKRKDHPMNRHLFLQILVAGILLFLSGWGIWHKHNEEIDRKREKIDSEEVPQTEYDIRNGILMNISNFGDTLVIPDGVKKIDPNAFANQLMKIRTIIISSTMEEAPIALFLQMGRLEKILVSENNESFMSMDGCLYSKSGDVLLYYPQGKKEKELILGEDVKKIASKAIVDTKLTKIVFPAGLKSLADRAIYRNSHLKEITVSEDNPFFVSDNGILVDSEYRELIVYPSARTEEEEYTIPKTVELIRDGAFYNSKLKRIRLSEALKIIQAYAFFGCPLLEEIRIPKSVNLIGKYAFYECPALAKIEVDPENNFYRTVDQVLFDDNMIELIRYPSGKQNRTYVIPESVRILSHGSFSGNPYLNEVIFPENLRVIEDRVFQGCKNLKCLKGEGTYISMGSYSLPKNKQLTVYAVKNSSLWGYCEEYGISLDEITK